MGNRGITIEQLESEIYGRLAELAEQCVEIPLIERIALVTHYTVYLSEVVKRWQTPGITPEKITEKSTQAMERRMRKRLREDAVAELRKLLQEEPDDHRQGSGEGAVPSGGGPSEKIPLGRTNAGKPNEKEPSRKTGTELPSVAPLQGEGLGRPPSGDGAEVPASGGVPQGGESSSLETTDTPQADSSGGADNGPSRGSEGDKGDLLMQQKTCPKCRASLGPEISSPKLAEPGISLVTVRPCPGCGWDPRVPPETPKKKPRPLKGPQPPKAGKSFSRG